MQTTPGAKIVAQRLVERLGIVIKKPNQEQPRVLTEEIEGSIR